MMLTLAKAKELLGISQEDISLGARFEALLQAAQQQIEQYTGRKLDYGEYEEWFDGSGACMLNVRAYPIETVQQVTIEGRRCYVAEFIADKETGQIRILRDWPAGRRNARVKYAGGYRTDQAPANLMLAVAMLAQVLDGLAQNGGQMATMERIGDYQINYARNVVGSGSGSGSEGGLLYIAPAVAALVRPYVARWI